MIIQLAEYCEKRAEKTFYTLIRVGDNAHPLHRERLVHELKHCKRVARYQHQQEKAA